MNHMQSLLSVYSPREARALYMLVMEVAFGLDSTQVLTGKDKELSLDKQALLQILSTDFSEKNPCSMFWGKPTSADILFMLNLAS